MTAWKSARWDASLKFRKTKFRAVHRVIVATSNAGKARELEEMLDLPDYHLETLAEAGIESDPVEDGDTFSKNALIKARAAFEICKKKGIEACVLADDSGICIDSLDGRPGVMSARYAGVGAGQDAINEKIFAELKDVPFEKRDAHFACSLVFIREDGEEIWVEGRCDGKIATEPIGDKGFGYDPIFLSREYDFKKTFGEIDANEKNEISHRGLAVKNLKMCLTGVFDDFENSDNYIEFTL